MSYLYRSSRADKSDMSVNSVSRHVGREGKTGAGHAVGFVKKSWLGLPSRLSIPVARTRRVFDDDLCVQGFGARVSALSSGSDGVATCAQRPQHRGVIPLGVVVRAVDVVDSVRLYPHHTHHGFAFRWVARTLRHRDVEPFAHEAGLCVHFLYQSVGL